MDKTTLNSQRPTANSQPPRAIMVFGVGELQEGIINRAHLMGLFVVGIDPCEDAFAKDDCDAFVVVGGQDFDGTIAVAKKYNVSAIVTAATDKPLVMMARVAKELNLPFYTVETAQWSTDKFQMKSRFMEGGVPCAKGILLTKDQLLDTSHWPLAANSQQPTANSGKLCFPVIVKPRDNSGSRGVKLCGNIDELQECISEALEVSKLNTVLVEEFIEGREFSIESLHYNGKSEVIQFTEKKTTEFPYNVELGHKQPANLTDDQRNQIRDIINKIAACMKFENCPSHTELKVNDRGIFVIETSPRLGGDYITSTLTPLSTGINMEDQLLHIALGEQVDTKTGRVDRASAVCFFSLPEGEVTAIDPKIDEVTSWPNVQNFQLKLKVGDKVNKITSSLNRYGQVIVTGENRKDVDEMVEEYENIINKLIDVKPNKKELQGKKLLVLGGNYSTVRVVQYAQEMGIYVVVTSINPTGEAKEIADEAINIDILDHSAIVKYIKENHIDGVMTGASEFHILNMLRICKLAGLPVYATEDQWNICQNKKSFKNLCRKYGVPCVKEFSSDDDPNIFEYPVIVKPTDGCSARGISVCKNPKEYNESLSKALEYSTEKKVIVEQFIQNGGTTMSVRYIVRDGELYLEAVGDRYVLDDNNGKALITAAAFYPSKYTQFYIDNIDSKVKDMYKGIGLRNGCLFMEACFYQNNILFYEMGLRLSGGMTYLITDRTNDVNEMKMLINFATTGRMCNEDDLTKIDPNLNGYLSASLCIPLATGKISTIEGVDKLKSFKNINTFTQYWHVGETVLDKHIGTLDQLFARVSVIVKGKEELADFIKLLIDTVSIQDEDGNEMFIKSKLEGIYNDYIN